MHMIMKNYVCKMSCGYECMYMYQLYMAKHSSLCSSFPCHECFTTNGYLSMVIIIKGSFYTVLQMFSCEQ